MKDPTVREQLKAKYTEPRAGEVYTYTYMHTYANKPGEDTPSVEHPRGLGDNQLSLDKTTSTGTGGLRPDYLTTLAHLMDAEQMANKNFELKQVVSSGDQIWN